MRGQVGPTPRGSGLLDDTVLDTNASLAIALVRWQYSGHAKAVSKGIGVVTCVYGHPARDQCWLSDSRLDDPDGEGQSKLDHRRARLVPIVSRQQRPFEAVLMDTWDATRALRLCMELLQKFSDCPRKDTRQVEDSGGIRFTRDTLPPQGLAAMA